LLGSRRGEVFDLDRQLMTVLGGKKVRRVHGEPSWA
jgi:hypothetical protein